MVEKQSSLRKQPRKNGLNADLSFEDQRVEPGNKGQQTQKLTPSKVLADKSNGVMFIDQGKAVNTDSFASPADKSSFQTPAFQQTTSLSKQGIADDAGGAKEPYYADSSFEKKPQPPGVGHSAEKHYYMHVNQVAAGSSKKPPIKTQIWSNTHGILPSSQANSSSQQHNSSHGGNQAINESSIRRYIGESSPDSSIKIVNGSIQPLVAKPSDRLAYERLPEPESDMGSEHNTVDLDRNRQPTKHNPHMQQDAESNGTIPTVKDQSDLVQEELNIPGLMETPARNDGSKTKSGAVTQQTKQAGIMGSSNRGSAGPEFDQEVSEMTQVVFDDAKLNEQDHHGDQHKDELENVAAGPSEHGYIDDKPLSSVNFGEQEVSRIHNEGEKSLKTEMLMRTNHNQSQSLENIRTLKQLQDADENLSQKCFEQKKFSQKWTKTIDSGEEWIRQERHNNQELLRKSADTRINPQNFRMNELCQSELAPTEVKGQEQILLSSQHMANNSVTIDQEHNYQHRADAADLTIENDSQLLETHTEIQVAKALDSQQHELEEVDNIDGQPSQTEHAISYLDSIDPKRSDCVDLGVFEEEKSEDWKRQQPAIATAAKSRTQTSGMDLSPQNAKVEDQQNKKTAAFPHQSTIMNIVANGPMSTNEDNYCLEGDPVSSQRQPVLSSDDYANYSGDQFELNSCDPTSSRVGDKIALLSQRVPTESQKDDSNGGEEDLYQSIKEQQVDLAGDYDNITKDFVDQEFNASHDLQNSGTNAKERFETDANQTGMMIDDGTEWVNAAPQDFILTQPEKKTSHKREVKSLEMKPMTSHSQRGQTSMKESGVEQFESDDGLAEVQQYSSIRDTSLTVEAPNVANRVSLPHSIADRASEVQESMAFDTIQHPARADISMTYEKENDEDYGQEAQNSQIEDAEAAQNAAISVQDESERALMEEEDGEEPMIASNISIMQDQAEDEPGELPTRDDILGDPQANTKYSSCNEGSPARLDEGHTSAEKNMVFTSRAQKSNAAFDSVGRSSSQKRFKRQRRKKRRSIENKKSKSPNSRENRNSKSPARQASNDVKLVIRNGKIMPLRQAAFDKHQFPIRKSNYNEQAVGKMLMNKGHFQESVRLMQRMKERISKYNQNVVPFAQQYYYAMQQNHQTLDLQILDQQSAQKEGNSTLQDEPASRRLITSTEAINGNSEVQSHRSRYAITPTIDSIQNSNRVVGEANNLPKFLREVSRPGQQIQGFTGVSADSNNITNIQLDNEGNYELQRLNNRTTPQPPSQAVVSQNMESQQDNAQRVTELSHPNIRTDSRIQAGHFVPRDLESQQIVRQSADIDQSQDKKSKTQQKRRERGSKSNNRGETPPSLSEFRFRPKKQQRRLVLQDQDRSLRKSVAVDQQNSTQVSPRHPNSILKSTRSNNFYPQDNLSLLLHAANPNPSFEGGYQHSQLDQVSLAQKFANNKIQARRSLTKNSTLGKIYHKNNARNLLVAVGALPSSQQPQSISSARNNSNEAQHPQGASLAANSDIDQQSIALKPQQQVSSEMGHESVDLQLAPISDMQSKKGLISNTLQHSSRKGLADKVNTTSNEKGVRQHESLQHGSRFHVSNQHSRIHQDQHRLNKGDESAYNKFQRWLEKGRPSAMQSPGNYLIKSDRRNVGKPFGSAQGQAQATNGNASQQAYQFNPPQPGSQFVQHHQEVSAYLADGAIMESFDEQETSQANVVSTQGSQEVRDIHSQDKINMSVALKLLNDPRFGNTIDQRRIKIEDLIEQGYADDLVFISSQGNHGNQTPGARTANAAVYSSFEQQQQQFRQPKSIPVSRYAARADSNSGSVDQQAMILADNNHPQSLPTLNPNDLRQSFEPTRARRYDRLFTGTVNGQDMNSNSASKLNDLSAIYSVPQGKKRQVFLKNNYTKSNYLVQAHMNKTNKLVEIRKSRSPRAEDQFVQGQVKGQNYFNNAGKGRLDGKNTAYVAKRNSLSGKSAAATPSSHAIRVTSRSVAKNVGSQQAHQSKAQPQAHSRTSATLPPKEAALRHQHHVANVQNLVREDTYEHPQISLNMPQQAANESKDAPVLAVATVSDLNASLDDGAVLIQSEQMQILPDSSGSRQEGDASAVVEAVTLIDQLQEQKVVESEHSIDQPQILAEDDRNPNLPTQQDQILGEQDISEDEAGEAMAAAVRVKKPASSYRLEDDTHRTFTNELDQVINTDSGARQQQPDPKAYPTTSGDGYDADEFESESQKRVGGKVDGGLSKGADEHEEEEEDYYADDKFVYEDVADQPSSEDPEQQFLKKHAEETARQSTAQEMEESKDESEMQQQIDNSLEKAIRGQRKTSQSHHLGQAAGRKSPGSDQDGIEGEGEDIEDEYSEN